MEERLTVDSVMTADGEVVQLPVLGPLGPVDAEGSRIPLDTVRLFDAEGRFLKVESYEFSTWSQRWVVHLDSGRDAYADDCYLRRPDSFERLLKDLGEALQQDARGGRLECGYNLAVGLCRGRIPEDGQCCVLTARGAVRAGWPTISGTASSIYVPVLSRRIGARNE